MSRYGPDLMIYELRVEDEPTFGGIGLAWAHVRFTANGLTGSLEGTLEENCDIIRHWGAVAVLSLTEFDIERASLPLDAFARAVRERNMRFYHLPVRDRHVPSPAFEEGWLEVGAQLRALIRQGNRVVIHAEGDLCRTAMIIARLMIELGCHPRLAFDALHEFREGLFPDGTTIGHAYHQEPVPEPVPLDTPAAIRDRAVGALLGLAVGDALGTTLEFKARDSYPALTDMVGGGPFRLRPGEWTDDTAMALALAETLQHHDEYDDWAHRFELIAAAKEAFASGKANRLARERLSKRIRLAEQGGYKDNPHRFERALMERFTRWMQRGAFSCNGRCFDIGMTVRAALERYLRTGNPKAGSTDPMSAGNGSLMRLAPVAIRYWDDDMRLRDYAARQSRTTHGAREAVDACVGYAELLADAIRGKCHSEVLATNLAFKQWSAKTLAERHKPFAPGVAAILAGSWRGKPRQAIRASGYVLHSLEAALWSVGRSLTFEEAVLNAANLGEDADTTAAIAGQLAGALYGASAIPKAWRAKLAWHDRIVSYAEALLPEHICNARGDTAGTSA